MPTKIAPLIKAKEEAKEPFVAFEYFPPRTEDGLMKLYDRVQRMKLQSKSYFLPCGKGLCPAGMH